MGSAAAPPHRIEWERWIGVRGAAVLGGIALALAGLLFFKYSIEHGLISPTLRVILGTVVGLAALGSAELARRRDYTFVANAVAGAGIVVLYSSFWAARALYGLIGTELAFVLMALVTATCALQAVRHRTLLVALLGLIGGFATPILISTGSDRPLGLFGYVLLLDTGFLVVAYYRRWAVLALLALAGTSLLQVAWIAGRMGPERLGLGLGILGLFALVFAVAGTLTARRAPTPATLLWVVAQAAGILLPFSFALVFAASTRYGRHLFPTGVLLVFLGAAAGWVARAQRRGWLATAAAAATVGTILMWLVTQKLDPTRAWEGVAVGLLCALVYHFFVEWRPGDAAGDGPAPAGMVAAIGLMVAFILAAFGPHIAPWPWLTGWGVLTLVLVRQASFPRREVLHLAAALGPALGLAAGLLPRTWGDDRVLPIAPGLYLALLVGAAVALQLVAVLQRAPARRRFAEHGAALAAVLLTIALAPAPVTAACGPLLALGASLALGVLAAFAATRLRSAPWYVGAVAVTALVHLVWTFARADRATTPRLAVVALGVQALAVVAFTAWPLLAMTALRAAPAAFIAAALAGPLWFLPARRLWLAAFGDGAIGLLPVLLGALALAALAASRRVLAPTESARRTALVWLAAVALGFVSVAIPLQLDREWITIGWALEGLGVIALWRRLDHPGLKWVGLALLGAATIRLTANAAVLEYHAHAAMPILNWLLYTYAVPAAALIGAALLLRPAEVAHARPWERVLYGTGRPVGAAVCGLGAAVVVFAWVNLAIIDWFSVGPTLTITFERQPARDLTTSIAWAGYALVLLALGVIRGRTGLRWISLALLLITIGKVFLYDLGHLKDLHRVMSLVGLALSLIMVSLAYQRFVFRQPQPPGAEPPRKEP